MVGRTLGGTLLTVGVLAAAWHPRGATGRTRTKTDVGREATAARLRQPPAFVSPSDAPSPFPVPPVAWREQREPTAGPVRVYGRTTCGCIAGAVPLPARGEGFVRRRPWRPTGFGHPDLVGFIERLGQATRRAGLADLSVGDMSLPRGGAYLGGHASHQTGLDVDIAYRAFVARPEERSAATWRVSSVPPLVRPRVLRRIETLLRLAAADEHVDRIFVGAGIKQFLCRTVTTDRGFLSVLRPWLGHEQHFHVRLKCPADSPECHRNEPVTTIPDDCESLSHWWKGANVLAAFADWRASERAASLRDLPDACQVLVGPTRNLAQKRVPPPLPRPNPQPFSPTLVRQR
jgi:penicillin-insensitive murein endopeptidase